MGPEAAFFSGPNGFPSERFLFYFSRGYYAGLHICLSSIDTIFLFLVLFPGVMADFCFSPSVCLSRVVRLLSLYRFRLF